MLPSAAGSSQQPIVQHETLSAEARGTRFREFMSRDVSGGLNRGQASKPFQHFPLEMLIGTQKYII